MRNEAVIGSSCFFVFGVFDILLAVAGYSLFVASKASAMIYSLIVYSEMLFIFSVVPNLVTAYGLLRMGKIAQISGIAAVPMNLIFTLGWLVTGGFLGFDIFSLPEPLAFAWILLPFALFSISSTVLLRNYEKLVN